MSTYSNQPYPPAQATPTNGRAIAGFVCSLLGLLTAGNLLTPVGLILSIVALGRPGNRGLAIWGVVLGVLGLCGWGLLVLISIFVGGGILLALLAGVGIAIGLAALDNPVKVEITADMARAAIAIEHERDDTGYLPADLAVLGLSEAVLTDPWGNPYTYRLTDETQRGYELYSAGEDGQLGSGDDIALSDLGELWNESGPVRVSVTDGEDGGRISVRIGNRTIDVDENERNVSVNIGGNEYNVEDEAAQDDAGD